jgi:hypothetical protein
MTETSAQITPVNRASSEFEHKQLIEVGKLLLSNFYPLATMSFVLNGTLLGAISFLIFRKADIHPDFLRHSAYFAASLGVIYNAGAFFWMKDSTITVVNLRRRFDEVDKALGLRISECRPPSSEKLGVRTYVLTNIFFVIWAGWWLYFAYVNYFNAMLV